MAPDRNDARNFIIEPWVDYAASGEIYDWSDKLVNDKDFILQPLFFTQSDLIEFDHKEDGDWLNKLHFDQFQREFGYLEFTSGNELLKGKREITTEWAPTPLTQIEGADTSNSFIIPQLHIHEVDGSTNQKVPIKPKTRFLYYNGLYSVDGGNQSWRLGDNTALTEYPLASYSSKWPMTGDGEVLNWNIDVNYWGNEVDLTGNPPVTNYPGDEGISLYDGYWAG